MWNPRPHAHAPPLRVCALAVWVPKLNNEVTVALPGKTPIPHNRSTTYMCMWVRPPTDPEYSKFHIYRTELVRALDGF